MFNVYAASRCTVFTVPCWNVMLTALSLVGILMGVAQTKVEPQRTVCQQCNCSLWAPQPGNLAEPFTKHLLEYTLGASRPDFPPLQSHQLQRVNNTRLPCSKGYSQRLMDLAVGTSYHLTLRCWVVIVFIYFFNLFLTTGIPHQGWPPDLPNLTCYRAERLFSVCSTIIWDRLGHNFSLAFTILQLLVSASIFISYRFNTSLNHNFI